MKLSVVIPVLNKWELTRACLESLREHTEGEIEVLLVDNASTDATGAEAPALGRALFGQGFVYLPQERNRNFAPACNIGARAARGEAVFFLNNDTLLSPGWLPPLLAALAQTDAAPDAPAAVAPLLLYPELGGRKNRVQHLGIVFDPQKHPRHLYEGFPARHPLCAGRHAFQAVTGAALLLRRDLFLGAGLFDESFVNGLEDVELCLRLRRQEHGAKGGLRVEHGSTVYHLASQTPGVHARAEHNARLLRQKAGGEITPDWARLAAEDGYVFRLSPALAGYLEPGPERAAAQAAARARIHADEAALLELLEEEPLWYAGYELLADLQEAASRPLEAAATLFFSLRLREDPALATRLLALARAARHSKYAAFAGRILGWYKPENFEHALRSAGFMRKFCLDSKQTEAAEAYALWLEERERHRIFYCP